MADDTNTQMVYEGHRKSVGLTYLLWLFFGWFGIHRFYAGATKSAIVQLVLALTGVGLLIQIPWWLLDSVLIPGVVREQNQKTFNLITHGNEEGDPAAHEEPRPITQADRKREAMLEDLRSTGYRKERRDTSYLYR